MTDGLGTVPVTGDVLTSGTERGLVGGRFRGWLRRHRVLVGGLLVALIVVALLDQWQRQREMEVLLREASGGEQTIDAADGALSVIVDYYNPLIYGVAATEQMRTGFRSDLSAAATDGAASTASTVATVSAVRILPWHRALVDARDVYRARVAGWTTYLQEVEAEPYTRFGQANDTLPSTIAAKDALLRAAPWPWVSQDSTKVNDLLAP